mgnify:CR=1 FL=1
MRKSVKYLQLVRKYKCPIYTHLPVQPTFQPDETIELSRRGYCREFLTAESDNLSEIRGLRRSPPAAGSAAQEQRSDDRKE